MPTATQVSYELLVHSIVDYAIYMLDQDGRIASWNKGAERILGYGADEVIGQSAAIFYPAAERRANREEDALAVAARTGRHAEEGWRIRKNGHRFWAYVALDAIRDETGELIGYAKVLRDMSERRMAEEKLRESERRFRLFVNSVSDCAICMLNVEGLVTEWNRGVRRIAGFQAEDVMGRHCAAFFAPEEREAGVPERLLEQARTEGKAAAECWQVRGDGSRFQASVIVDAVHDQSNRLLGFALVMRDVTERRDGERHLEEARAQLFQAQKIEALGQLTSGIAHDFNNLLQGIIGSLEVAKLRADQGALPDTLRFIGNAHHAADRAATLTHRLLAFARRQPLVTRAVDVRESILGMEQLLRQTVGESITLRLDFPREACMVRCDPHHFESSLLNLAINARDAMREGGLLSIAIGQLDHLDSQSRIPHLARGRYVAIAVSDNGCGMDEDTLKRAMDPFFTTKPKDHGTGLGLSMVYGFAVQSGGTMRMRSEPGCGTTVTLYLPVGLAAEELAEPVAARPRKLQGQPTILLVEDEPAVREPVALRLREMGFEVIEADNGYRGLEILRSPQPLDLAIADIGLPGINGRIMIDKAPPHRQGLRVLFTTGYADSWVLQQGPPLGEGMDMLTKPFDMGALLSKIYTLAGVD
ncbi:PAS domain S-box protein [Dyella sp. LX-66]|uniref:hybrid sensor histidine kinase/response regulator n=1 Tax=unclassified Dyella TaxID=2634549 RepID=UPI001BDFA8ED|nr:PAS domain S-box protein [Dyella sp. LX-1]MBT2139962.1 PAS domain S-box protein [Dyella sp. LX-66]